MKFNKNAFVIVDAYTTGRFLAPYLNANGYSCIHVQSREEVISVYQATFSRENFNENLVFSDDIAKLIEQLQPYNVKAVIPGAETGVLLADLLSEELHLATSNGTKASLARRDKYEMMQYLAKHNIRYAKSLKSNQLTEIIKWVEDASQFPVVVKPIASSGSFGVKICYSIDDVKQAYQNIIHQNNVFNEENTSVMIQEFLNGQEYIVNTVSYAGSHRVVDIWRKFKKLVDGIPINDYSELVSPNEPEYVSLAAYNAKVLDALEIKFGASHSELMLTVDGPVLIETAARLAGSIDPSALLEALNENQVACLLKSYLDPKNFLLSNVFIYPNKHARHVFFMSPLAGIINELPNLNQIINLSSFHSVSFRFDKVGDQLLKTTTLADFPGFAYLVADSKEQLEADYAAFRQIENKIYFAMIAERC